MGFMGTVIERTHTVSQFRSREQALRLDDLTLAVQPLGFMTPILVQVGEQLPDQARHGADGSSDWWR
jgi:hypothetical protein